ncbi:UDP-glycosyltransferase 90A1-like [Salvia miltiorrhiza]|uniref:UDP-glycosyltransferase 90A1-like n=1 Tax=Salvia miltiorrhiza TaxID=226208 RepID=UPI0025ABA859|nr:UDP-glycosyltransferase 90A1-like [Salvia miltiorrhiza]
MGSPHILLFPFLAKGHAIPLLHLARLLLHHGAAVTLVTTPANRSFIRSSLPSAISVVDIPFPQNIPGIPPGVESTDKLPNISLWVPLAAAAKLMQPHFDQLLKSLLPAVSLVISDDFFPWTLDSATRHGVPRFVFYAMGAFSLSLILAVARRRFVEESSGDTLNPTDFPWIKIRREDIDPLFIDPEFVGTDIHNFAYENIESSSRSHGIVINTFFELESAYVNAYPKMWCLGPFSTAVEPPENDMRPASMKWLDEKLGRGERVMYAAFGTQVEISPEQFEEIKKGLEESGVNFLLVVRKNEAQLMDGFEERVRGRGIVVREWVNQREILGHGSVAGFLSQCGWTSVMESVCAKVPILAMPGMWEQPLNAVLVAEELRVGLRVKASNGFVKWESLAAAAKELMEGELGDEVRRNAAELGGAAMRAVEEGGSSWLSLKKLLSEFGHTT